MDDTTKDYDIAKRVVVRTISGIIASLYCEYHDTAIDDAYVDSYIDSIVSVIKRETQERLYDMEEDL